jgi:hypothetical protein
MRNTYQILAQQPGEERPCGHLRIDEGIILKWIVKK